MQVTIHEEPLQLVVPEHCHEDGHKNLGEDVYLVMILSQDGNNPVRVLHPLSEKVSTPCIERDAAQPDKEKLQGNEALATVAHGEHPLVIHTAIDHATKHSPYGGGHHIVHPQYRREQHSADKIHYAGYLSGEEGFNELHE